MVFTSIFGMMWRRKKGWKKIIHGQLLPFSTLCLKQPVIHRSPPCYVKNFYKIKKSRKKNPTTHEKNRKKLNRDLKSGLVRPLGASWTGRTDPDQEPEDNLSTFQRSRRPLRSKQSARTSTDTPLTQDCKTWSGVCCRGGQVDSLFQFQVV